MDDIDVMTLAAAGRKIFPVVYKDKNPLVDEWPSYAKLNEDEIVDKLTSYSQCNVGMLTGKHSGVLTIDTDFKHPEAIKFWEEHKDMLSLGCVVNTGNGKHSHFKHPGTHVLSSIGGIDKGVDLLCDTKDEAGARYVLIPDSLHPNGKHYEYDDMFGVTLGEELPDPPQELMDLINDKSRWRGKTNTSSPLPQGVKPAEWYAENPQVLFNVDPYGDDEPILEGNRNNDLAKLAGKLLYMNENNQNYILEDLKEDLQRINEARCDPPIDIIEIDAICESIFKTKARRDKQQELNQSKLDGFKFSADDFLEDGSSAKPTGSKQVGIAFSLGVLPCPETKPEVKTDVNGSAVWILHQEPFAPSAQGCDHNLVYLEGQFFQRFNNVWVTVTEQAVESVFQSFYISAKKSEVSNMMSFAKNYLYLPMKSMPFWKAGFATPTFPEDPRKLIPFGNGLFNVESYIKTGVVKDSLMPFTDNLFNTMKLPYDLDESAACPRWEAFLTSIWGSATCDRAEALREWIGHLMIPDITQHKIAILHGVPRSGKSTIGRIIRRVVGHENAAAANILALSGSHGLSPYVGKNAMIFFDAHMSSKIAGEQSLEILKTISGGDPVQINRKYHDPYDITLSARIMMVCNEMPRFKDSGNALLSRLIPFRFEQTFFGQEDKQLESDLVKELPGIALWALEGIRRYISNGKLSMPNEAIQDLQDMKRVMNPVSAFADDCLIFPTADPNDYVYVNDLHRAWISWAEENYITYVDTKDRFLSKLRAVAPTILQCRSKGAPVWKGIKFRTEAIDRYIKPVKSNNLF